MPECHSTRWPTIKSCWRNHGLFFTQRRLAAGALQHQPRRPAAQPWSAGAQVLCGNAHSRRGRPVSRHGPFLLRLSGHGVVGRYHLDIDCGNHAVSSWSAPGGFGPEKRSAFSRRHPFQVLFLIAIVLYVIFKYSQGILFVWALVYMFSGIWARAAYSWSRRRRWRLTGRALLPNQRRLNQGR